MIECYDNFVIIVGADKVKGEDLGQKLQIVASSQNAVIVLASENKMDDFFQMVAYSDYVFSFIKDCYSLVKLRFSNKMFNNLSLSKLK